MRLSPFAAFLFFGRHFAAAKETENDPDYLLIGAGGGSLQMALFLQRHNYTYKILEQKDVVGSHWTSFPVFDELISVNKYTRNENQRLRYDWHSFLEAPRQMYDVTDEYFPKGQDFHRYMSLVAKEAGILPNVEFNVQVDRVLDDGTPCVLLSTGEKRCGKKRVFVGTGLTEKKEPYLQAMGGIPYSKITKDMARRRRVCILGNGNSGFEVAQNLFGVAEKVVLFGRSPPRWSSVTRYTGDVRTKYLQVLENYNAKLLDDVGFFSSDTHYGSLDGLDGLSGSQKKVVETMVQVVTWLHEFQCETFVITTGFQSSTPTGLDMILGEDEEGANEYNRRRFPPTDDWYQSTNNPSVHFLGWLMHERDFRRGAGGFLSGYRYLVRNLFYQIHAENQGKPYPNEILTKEQAIARAVERVQTADDLIILQDGKSKKIVPTHASHWVTGFINLTNAFNNFLQVLS